MVEKLLLELKDLEGIYPTIEKSQKLIFPPEKKGEPEKHIFVQYYDNGTCSFNEMVYDTTTDNINYIKINLTKSQIKFIIPILKLWIKRKKFKINKNTGNPELREKINHVLMDIHSKYPLLYLMYNSECIATHQPSKYKLANYRRHFYYHNKFNTKKDFGMDQNCLDEIYDVGHLTLHSKIEPTPQLLQALQEFNSRLYDDYSYDMQKNSIQLINLNIDKFPSTEWKYKLYKPWEALRKQCDWEYWKYNW
jgi:hypothetical protein